MRIQDLSLICTLLACMGCQRVFVGDMDSGQRDTAKPNLPQDTGGLSNDLDGDGFDSNEDCDDTSSSIYPGAEEIPYDGIDQDCDGQDFADVDDDGFVSDVVGGEDCDDENPSVNPYVDEVENGIDDDCDGEIDEGVEGPYDDWPALIRGSNGEVYLEHLAIGSDGGIHAAGHWDGKADFDPNPESQEEASADGSTEDIFLIKVDENRDLLWLAGLTSESTVIAHDVHVDLDDQVIIVGSYDQTLDFDIDIPTYVIQSVGEMDGFVGLYDSDGSLSWGASVGGDGDDSCTSVAVIDDSDIWIGGSYSNNHDFDPGAGDADIRESPGGDTGGYVLRLDENGTYLAHFVFTGESEEESEDSEEGKKGDGEKEKKGGSDTGNTAEVRHLAASSNGLVVVGLFTGTIDMDPSEDGITELVSEGEPGIFIVSLDIEGLFQWAVSIDGDYTITPSALAIPSNDDIYLVGSFEGSVDLDPGEDVEIVGGVGELDGFVVLLDENGEYSWSTRIVGSETIEIHNMDVDEKGNIYLSGNFNGTFTFGESELNSSGGSDCMVGRIHPDETPGWAFGLGTSEDETCKALTLGPDEEQLFVGGWMGSDMNFSQANWDYEHLMEGVIDAWFLYTPVAGP